MKKLLSLFCLFTLLTAFTCENEPLDDGIESGSNDTNVALIGSWELVDFDVTLQTSTEFMGETFSSDIDIQSTEENYVLTFTESNFTTAGDYTYDTNVAVNGATVTSEPYTLDNVSGSGTYSTSGNEMTIYGSFFEFEFEGMDENLFQDEQTTSFSISADGQTLTFTQEETVSQTDPITGIISSSTTSGGSTWTKQ
ncbi:hypothetical protein HNV10_03160 [Winogradskyella litoriviva]|uniref:Lipocalin-like domain-containing protein n=1 Tax=Winogradskyella litoriviva TaxID=1220182 RepID=A0ABX2E1V0_9FLAO|nr:hypothetical protein [Winogradskyella litoriviva]NRD22224.1 hypothetical protein [Winogradskyella litoriviva]